MQKLLTFVSINWKLLTRTLCSHTVGAATARCTFFFFSCSYILFWPLSKPDSGLSFSTKPTEASGEFLQATSTIGKLDIRCPLRQITKLRYCKYKFIPHVCLPISLSRPIIHVGSFEEAI